MLYGSFQEYLIFGDLWLLEHNKEVKKLRYQWSGWWRSGRFSLRSLCRGRTRRWCWSFSSSSRPAQSPRSSSGVWAECWTPPALWALQSHRVTVERYIKGKEYDCCLHCETTDSLTTRDDCEAEMEVQLCLRKVTFFKTICASKISSVHVRWKISSTWNTR